MEMQKTLLLLCSLIVLAVSFNVTPVVIAVSSYNGHWEDHNNVGQYGMDQMMLDMKSKGNQVTVEVSNDYFIPFEDSRESFKSSVGRIRSSVVNGTVVFNSKGQASFKYKNEYNNGQMSIQMQNDGVKITWTGKEVSEFSFPQGTFKLYKKINVGAAEMKKLGTFLSNFTELNLDEFDAKRVNNAELIRFGVWHNYINNFNSRISTSNGKLFISKTHVETSIQKYFNTQFRNHRSVNGFGFNGKGYIFDGADGMPVYYVRAQDVFDLGQNKLRVRGVLYDADSPSTEMVSEVEAVVKKVKVQNNISYALVTLKVKR
ncbi:MULTISPECIES: hypothetical protein [Paenibacillus]|uniref:hypothetical protein n=1 Tax=Paenibacillus TaxID=44249 RepID=UPI0030D2F0F6